MSKQQLIVLDKIDPNQLPELANFKEKGFSLLKECSFIKIEDNSTYEIAKKHRTALKSYRTDVQKSEKAIKDKINSFKNKVQVVSAELIEITQIAENKQQSEITIWEDKKEQERIEKVRLEELRVKQIKEAIQTFKDAWTDNVNHLLFEGIAGFNEMFDTYSAKFDRSKLAEFEVLFDDAISVIRQLADSKIKTLREQEQIRVDNLLIKEKNAENTKISNFSHEWNSNIDSLKTSDIEDVKETFKRAKIMGLKHFQSNFDEVYSALEKRLNSQIEFISFQEKQRLEQEEIAEKQRIAQEKFQKEKAEFEAKQLEAKFQDRCKQIIDLGFVLNETNIAYKKGIHYLNLEDIKSASDDLWLRELEDAKNVKYFSELEVSNQTQEVDFEEVKTNEIAQEQIRESDEEDVHEVATAKTIEKESLFDVSKIENQIWNNIYEEWNLVSDKYPDAFEYLKEFYHSPKKKD